MFRQITLDNNTTIYRGKYQGEYNQDDFIKIVKINEKLVNPLLGGDSVPIEVESDEFHSVNEEVKKFLTSIDTRKFKNYSQNFWIYTQRKDYDVEWMHQHILVHPSGRSMIKTDYTFTFYVQTTDEIEDEEGDIVFETEDGCRHHFHPEEGDIFIFPSDLLHTAIPTPNSNKERIVYAGNLCFNVEYHKKKNII